MKEDYKLAVVIPTLNEEKTLPKLLEELNKLLGSFGFINKYKLIVIDDGSTDKSVEKIKHISNVKLISHGYNIGIGAAVRSGLQYAEENKYDLVLKIDADFQHDISDIEDMILPILYDEVDLVFGDRFSGQITYKMPKIRFVGNKFFTFLMSKITKYNITDSQPGMFAGNLKFLSNVTIFSDYNYTQQVIYSSYLSGLRFKQVSINFNIREHGKSFVKLSYPFKALMQIVILMLTKNPMKSLGSLAFLTFAITIFTSVTQLVDYFNGVAPKPLMNVNLILGLGLLSSQLLLTAIILKSIGNIEYYIRTKVKSQ